MNQVDPRFLPPLDQILRMIDEYSGPLRLWDFLEESLFEPWISQG